MIPAGGPIGWSLVHDGRVLASAQVATTRSARRRGLRGLDRIDGVLVLRARSVHTIGMRVPIDVAHLDRGGVVRRLRTMAPGRVGRFVPGAPVAVEGPAGAFTRWGVTVGDRLELVA